MDFILNEKNRITNVFDNFYYKGLSTTNKKNPINVSVFDDTFNYFLQKLMTLKILCNSGLNDTPNYKLLDAGCGNGNMIRSLIEYGFKPENCYGIDVSNEVISYAKHNSSPFINFSEGLIDEKLKGIEDDFFDIVISYGVFIHILNDDYIQTICKEINRVLKKDGIFICLLTDESMVKMKEHMKNITRAFPMNKEILEKIFISFNIVGKYPCYSYGYNIPHDLVLRLILENNFNTCENLIVFKAVK